ncbi:MAG: sigma 54-interacting transcriptional regulator [Planctomycetota bacterium]
MLLVEDDPGNRRILENRLSTSGHEVAVAESGAQGLSLARESRFDLVLVSAELKSGVDGFEVCRRTKALPEGVRPGIILYCEQSPVPEVIERGYTAGSDAFVTRPDLPGLEHVLAILGRQRARVTELESEIARLADPKRRQDPPPPAVSTRDRAAKEGEDRAGALRELACGRPEGVLVVDAEGTVRHADRGACELFGGTIEGRHLGDLAPASGLEAFVRDARLETREGFRFDLAARKGHPGRSLTATVVPLVVHSGNPDSEIRVVLLHDAARRRLAAEVLRLQDPSLARQELGPLLEAARETYRPHTMVGASPATAALRQSLAAWSRTHAPVLLVGERGTGKERAARILHYSGPSTGAFVQLSCGALAPENLDLELFGRVRGSTPGALADRPGLFHLAQDGTLYLDEIADAPVATQERILKFLEEGVVSRVGTPKSERLSVRLVLSTSAPLEGRLREGRFSEGLLRRLESFMLALPPLGERLEDVPMLVRHYLGFFGSSRGVLDIDDEALAALSRHSWPGNVSELVDCIEQACAGAASESLGIADLPAPIGDSKRAAAAHDVIPALPPVRAPRTGARTGAVPAASTQLASAGAGGLTGARVDREVPRGVAQSRDIRPWDITDDDPICLELYERKALLRALDRVGGDRLAAAKLLNVGKSTLYRKLKQFGIA